MNLLGPLSPPPLVPILQTWHNIFLPVPIHLKAPPILSTHLSSPHLRLIHWSCTILKLCQSMAGLLSIMSLDPVASSSPDLFAYFEFPSFDSCLAHHPIRLCSSLFMLNKWTTLVFPAASAFGSCPLCFCYPACTSCDSLAPQCHSASQTAYDMLECVGGGGHVVTTSWRCTPND